MFTYLMRVALALGALTALAGSSEIAAADDVCCAPAEGAFVGVPVVYIDGPESNSWIFRSSTYSHDPATGVRVAQYERKPPVEPLDDQRNVTSSYRRTRTVNRGRDGSIDTSYQVQAYGNGRGGIDAEWQMFNDVWQDSFLTENFYNQSGGSWRGNGWGPGWNNGWGWGGGPGWNNGWNPGWGGGPGWNGGGGWNSGGVWNGPGWNGGPPNGPWNGGGPHGGGGHHGGGPHGGRPGKGPFHGGPHGSFGNNHED